jgi:hypothetical protein
VSAQGHEPDLSEGELVCPSCGRRQPNGDRFCARCGMPLVHRGGGEQPAGARRRRARKIKPQYTQGATVVVAHARNQVEAEFIEGLLLEEGIPCVLRAAIAGYAPVVGTRDVLVPESGAQAAREALAWQPPAGGEREGA